MFMTENLVLKQDMESYFDGFQPSAEAGNVVSVVSEVYKYQWTSKDWPCFALTLPAAPVKQRSAILVRGTKQIRHQYWAINIQQEIKALLS